MYRYERVSSEVMVDFKGFFGLKGCTRVVPEIGRQIIKSFVTIKKMFTMTILSSRHKIQKKHKNCEEIRSRESSQPMLNFIIDQIFEEPRYSSFFKKCIILSVQRCII